MRLILCTLLLLPLASRAATYYVATTGSDSATGSEAAPFSTAAKASTVAQAGDLVLLQPGIYSARNVITRGGTTNSHVTYRANGAVTNQGQWVIDGSNITIDGFQITGGGAWLNGADSIYIGSGRSNVWVVNNYFHDAPGGWDTAVSANENGWAYSCVVSNNIVHHWGASQDAVFCPRGWDWVVVGNTISNTFGGDAFRTWGGRNTIRNNRVVQFGSTLARVYGAGNPAFNGFYYYNDALTTLHKPPNSPTDRQVLVHTNLAGYCWFNFVDDNQFDSITYATYGWSNKVSLGLSDRSITYASAPSTTSPLWTMHNATIITQPTGGVGNVNHPDFIQIFGSTVSTNHLIEGNWVEGNTVGAIAQLSCETLQQPQPIGKWTFRNNVFINVRSASCNIETYWYNNAFYMCGDDSQSALSLSMHNPDKAGYRGSAAGSSVKGNIFIAGAGGAYNKGWYSVVDDDPYVADNISTNCDYNYVARDTNTWAKVRQPNNNYPPDSYSWYEPHGFNGGDPGLPFLHLLSFRHGPTSKLIDAGTAVTTTDAEGIARDKGSVPDIGPYEYDSSLKAWWTFDDNVVSEQRLIDWTGGGHTAWNGNPTNWITVADGPRGKAGVWRQVGTMTNAPPAVYVLSQYAVVTNLTGIDMLTNGSISLWVQWGKYTNDYTGATRHATLLDSGGTTLQYASPSSLATNSWKLSYGPPTSTQPAIGPTFYRHSTSANAPSIMGQFAQSRDESTWYHMVATWDAAAGKVVLYQDGVALRTNSYSADFLRVAGRNPLSPPFEADEAIPWLSIGASTHGGSLTWGDDKYPNDGYFVGKMDDIRIYNRAIGSNEVTTLYTGTSTLSLPPTITDPEPTPPVITAQSQSQTVTVGQTVVLSIIASGTAPLTYQWAKDGQPINATGSSLMFPAITAADAGLYWCTVYNDYGSATSADITVSVAPAPPQNLGVIQGAGIIEGNGEF